MRIHQRGRSKAYHKEYLFQELLESGLVFEIFLLINDIVTDRNELGRYSSVNTKILPINYAAQWKTFEKRNNISENIDAIFHFALKFKHILHSVRKLWDDVTA